ncbi:acylneuraminate cytidylyltransferase family protein [Dendrosporobacter sp. 1207_IL3150]|uniref:acylneuraminate cytidylyltransferase family protein n=1 Tax=Dendrosporobacter sp. 1207_IL3150 TaxID=3084054 RepID=UPI002FD97B4C
MFDNKKILALIPARGGSKGIKNKNIKELNGKPLIAYTIEAASAVDMIDDVIVTTDSPKIAEVSQQYGATVPFLRPAHLAGDTAKTIDAVLHAIQWLEDNGKKYDILVLLQPTQPLRSSSDIQKAIKVFLQESCKSLVSVSPVNDNPVLIRTLNSDMTVNKLLSQNSTVRRQDMAEYYHVNGAIYINYIKDLTVLTSFNDNESAYIMDKRNSVDIDTHLDWIIAESLIASNSLKSD